MALSILISDPDEKWANEVLNYLGKHSYVCEKVINGKDCQLKVYKNKYLAVILDLETYNNSSLEVLRYLRLNAPSVKVLLTVKSKERLDELELEKEELRKLGASDILIKPYSLETLLESVEGANQFEAWKDIKTTISQKDEEEVQARDDEFTKINILDFYSGNTNIFDCYIRLSPNKYVKILHKGEFFEDSRVKKHSVNNNITHLYFKTKERAMYINFINTALDKMMNSSTVKTSKKVSIIQNLTEKYIEEVYTSGLKPQLVEEGKKLCENIYNLIKRDEKLGVLMARYRDEYPPAHAHLFLVAFFSSIACQNLEWSSQRTVEIIAFGSLLHDIGKLKLPSEFNGLSVNQMTTDQLEVYMTHPRLGAELLQQYSIIGEPVRQIVYQHHEYVNGEGFPNKLTGLRIYPLAKVVAFADEFANFIMENKLSPIEGLRLMLQDRNKIMRFDPEVVKALIKSFVEDKK